MPEAGQIKIVLHRGGADHQIPHRQARIQAARHAGIDKRPHVEAIDQGLGAQGGADLADAAAGHHGGLPGQKAIVKVNARMMQHRRLLHLLREQLHFRRHGADDADNPHIVRPFYSFCLR